LAEEFSVIGQTISHYRILEKLGEGGMGVVYKAQDITLERFVALKFLPAHLAASEQDKARFTQEAKAASALNHPNVCTIHDIQEHEGQMFIVMEFVDGQTLREKGGTISFKQAIDIGIQIADGLAAAHEKGIVHRDIKPENIMIRKDGIAQIMDFGLAKLRGAAGVSRLTKEGSTVGTAGYMSPEQVQGQDADHRSDIFSFGVLLYELFTGQLPFKGVHDTALAYEIVNVEAPSMNSIKQGIDPSLDAIVLECMAKEPSERYQSAAEVAKELRRHKRESGRSKITRVQQVSPVAKDDLPTPLAKASGQDRPIMMKRERILWVGGLALAVATSLFLLLSRGNELSSRPLSARFTIQPPEKTTINETVVSPDAKRIAFTAMGEGRTLLWIRPLNELNAQPLPETGNAEFPFWSPDSRVIGFFADGKLKKIDVSGGTPIVICDAPGGFGGTWSVFNELLFSTNNGGLLRVPSGGGVPKQVTSLDSTAKESSHRWPTFLPDGKQFLYTVLRVADEALKTYLSSLDDTTKRIEVIESEVNVLFAPPSNILFLKSRTLMSQTFDLGQGKLVGEPRPVAADVGFIPLLGLGDFSYSAAGVLTTGGGRAVNREYRWFGKAGEQFGSASPHGNYFDIALSPSGHHAAVQRVDIQTGNSDIWIIDLQRGVMSRFTFDPAVDDDPVWGADGTYLYFSNTNTGTYNVHRKFFTGVGSPEVVTPPGLPQFPADVSRDGKYLLYTAGSIFTTRDIWVLDLGKGERKPLIESDFNESYPRFSPDVRWITYCSDESGKDEVYVQSYSAAGGRWQVSTNGGSQPRWRQDGRELFYVAPDLKLMSVEVRTGATFDFGSPKPLFQTRMDSYNAPNRYVVAENGLKFLINVPVGEEFANPVTVTIGPEL